MVEEQKNYGYGKRPLWQWIVLYLIIGIIVYGLLYYFFFAKKGGYNYNQTSNQYQYPTATQQNVTTSPTTAPSTGAALKISVTGSEFAFTPSTITVKAGQPVQITFTNDGKYPHNLTITDLNVQTKTIQPGEQDTITFTPTKIGSFTYLCTVPGHADKGMKGTLVVQ